MRNPAQEIIEAMQILIDNAMKKITSVNSGIITAINNNGKYSVKHKGKINSLPAYPKNVKISSGFPNLFASCNILYETIGIIFSTPSAFNISISGFTLDKLQNDPVIPSPTFKFFSIIYLRHIIFYAGGRDL